MAFNEEMHTPEGERRLQWAIQVELNAQTPVEHIVQTVMAITGDDEQACTRRVESVMSQIEAERSRPWNRIRQLFNV